jgi:hypothetical protein
MIWISLILSVTYLAVVLPIIYVDARRLRSMQREHARREDALLARIMHLAGKTWEIPPSREAADAEDEYDAARFTFTPEQDPDL